MFSLPLTEASNLALVKEVEKKIQKRSIIPINEKEWCHAEGFIRNLSKIHRKNITNIKEFTDEPLNIVQIYTQGEAYGDWIYIEDYLNLMEKLIIKPDLNKEELKQNTKENLPNLVNLAKEILKLSKELKHNYRIKHNTTIGELAKILIKQAKISNITIPKNKNGSLNDQNLYSYTRDFIYKYWINTTPSHQDNEAFDLGSSIGDGLLILCRHLAPPDPIPTIDPKLEPSPLPEQELLNDIYKKFDEILGQLASQSNLVANLTAIEQSQDVKIKNLTQEVEYCKKRIIKLEEESIELRRLFQKALMFNDQGNVYTEERRAKQNAIIDNPYYDPMLNQVILDQANRIKVRKSD